MVGCLGILLAPTRSLGATHKILARILLTPFDSLNISDKRNVRCFLLLEKIYGGCGGNRTLDRWLKRPLLYRLSYAPIEKITKKKAFSYIQNALRL